MVSSSGEIEFVSENVTNYLQYSQVSCACYVYIPSSVYKLFVLVLLAAADVLFDASASAAAKMHIHLPPPLYHALCDVFVQRFPSKSHEKETFLYFIAEIYL